jgi:hypothetical protein
MGPLWVCGSAPPNKARRWFGVYAFAKQVDVSVVTGVFREEMQVHHAQVSAAALTKPV